MDGVKKGLKEAHGGIKVVKEVTGQFDRNQAVGAMEDILQTNPRRQRGVRGQRPDGARRDPGDRRAQKTEQIKLIGFDGALEATQHILAGDMQATIAQDPYGMAKIGVQEAVAKLHGKPVKRNVNTGARLITPQNAPRYFKEVRDKLGHTGRGLGASR